MALSEYSTRLLGAYAEQPFLMAPMAGVTDPATASCAAAAVPILPTARW